MTTLSKTLFPRRAIHLDFHTMPGVRDVGRDFRPAEFARTLAEAEVDAVTVFARCNLGFAYYPTKLGTVHPGLVRRDLLGPMVAACHRRGIRVAAYFNGGISHEEALRHREWAKVAKDGHIYRMLETGYVLRQLCLNTAYGDHLLGMIREVLEAYPVDGLFLDCFDLAPCYGLECLNTMAQRGLDSRDDVAAAACARQVTDQFLARVQALCRQMGKSIPLCFNSMPYRMQPRHIELEILPTSASWGYDALPFSIRYARTLGKPFFVMTGRFHKGWGDFGGLRPDPSLLYDCFNALANGGGCSIGDHLHPRGRLENAVYEAVGRTYRAVKRYDPWTVGARALADMAVLYPPLEDPRSRPDYSKPAIKGAARLLMELKYQFDVIDRLTEAAIARYRVLILPDHVLVDARLAGRLRRFLARGGVLFSSAFSGLDPEKKGFALQEYRLDYLGPSPFNLEFFRAAHEVAEGLPDMPLSIYRPGIVMRPRPGCRSLGPIIRPYGNLYADDHFHRSKYIAPDVETDASVLTQAGRILHVAFPVFTGYYEQAVPAYKALVRNSLARVFPEPMIKTEGFPSFGQATVTAQGRRRMVHLLTYLPELRGQSVQIIEEPMVVRAVGLSLRPGARPVRSVYLAPSREPLEFRESGGYVQVVVPEVNGYQVVVFE